MRMCPVCAARFSHDTLVCPHDGAPTTEAPAETSDALIGQVLDGRYRVESRIGEGGMGVVYLATHVTLGRKLALKVLRSDMARDVAVVQRFMQEARSASSIGHPNIVDIHDFGRLPDGSVFFAMEYLEGESLSALIGRQGPFALGDAIRTIEPIASALGAAHALGIVHRDLKPDNIFLARRADGQPTIKVLDFGVAKVGGAASKMTRTGVVFGTPHYMSPEQAGGQSVDARTDVYALGVIMYEMMTGQVPFDADTFMGILTRHMFEAPPRPSPAGMGGACAPLEPVVLKCLAKRPEDRFQSMDELLEALRVVRSGGAFSFEPPAESTAEEPRNKTTLSTTHYRLPRDRAMFGAVAGVGLLALAGVVGIVVWLGSPEDAPSTDPTFEAVPRPPAMKPKAEAKAALAVPTPSRDTLPRGVDPEQIVHLESEPTGAEVVVDDAVIGNTPLPLPRPASGEERRIVLRYPGHETTAVALTSSSPSEIRVALPKPVATTMRSSKTRSAKMPATKRDGRLEPEGTSVRALSPSNLDVVDPWAR